MISTLKNLLEQANEETTAIERVEKGLRKRIDELADDFRQSAEFRGHMEKFYTSLTELSSSDGPKPKLGKVYVVMKPFLNLLIANKQPSTAPKNVSTTGADSNVAAQSASSPSTSGGSIRQKRRLEQTIGEAHHGLAKLTKAIKTAGSEELSLDDLDKEQTPFTMMEQLQKKYVRTAQKLANLEKQPLSISSSPIVFKKSGFESIDKAVTKLIRLKKRQSSQGPVFSIRSFEVPNYADILQIIRRENENHSLGLSADATAELAKRVGSDVMELVKAKTFESFNEYLSEIAEGDQSLPSDPELEDKLKKNDEIKQEQLEQLTREIEQSKSEEIDEANIDAEPADECHESDISDDQSEPSDDIKNGDHKQADLDAQTGDHEALVAGHSGTAQGEASGDTDNVMFAITPGQSAKRIPKKTQESISKKHEPEIIDLSEDEGS